MNSAGPLPYRLILGWKVPPPMKDRYIDLWRCGRAAQLKRLDTGRSFLECISSSAIDCRNQCWFAEWGHNKFYRLEQSIDLQLIRLWSTWFFHLPTWHPLILFPIFLLSSLGKSSFRFCFCETWFLCPAATLPFWNYVFGIFVSFIVLFDFDSIWTIWAVN